MQTFVTSSWVEGPPDLVSSELIRHLSHELGDSLGAVESLVYMAQRKSGQQDQVRQYLCEIPRLVDQANRVLRGAAHCLGAVPMRPVPANLNVLVAEAAVANYSERGPQLRIDLAPAELTVLLDPGHGDYLFSCLVGVFQKLVQGSGEMLVRTWREGSGAELEFQCAARHKERDIARLSEPFRPLAAARSVVTAHGGRLTAGCSASPGTWLRISLPLHEIC